MACCAACGSNDPSSGASRMRNGQPCCPECSDAPTGQGSNSFQIPSGGPFSNDEYHNNWNRPTGGF